MPLVNAHTHLELSALAHLMPRDSLPFAIWLRQLGGQLRGRDKAWFRSACETGIEALLAAGTTHVGDICYSGASVEPLIGSGLRGIVWLEMRGVLPTKGVRRLAWLKREVDRLRDLASNSLIRIGVEVHSPYMIHPRLWKPVLRWIDEEQLPLCLHAAESPSEWELFVDGTGDLRMTDALMTVSKVPRIIRPTVARSALWFKPWLHRIGVPFALSRNMTPVAYLNEMGALQHKPLLVHMVQVTDDDIRLVRESEATVVHCPRSNQRLQCGRMPLEDYLAAGVPVLFGTDSLTSSPTLDVRDELAAARQLHGDRVEFDKLESLTQDTSFFE